MNSATDSQNWYAIHVRTRWERSAATIVAGKGYEVFLPTYLSKRRWSDRLKEVKSALFPGYFFCRFDIHKRLPILVTPGVIGVVGQGRTPIPVDESEVLSIQNIISSGAAVEPWPYIEVGQKVRIDDHAFRGLEGILVGRKGNQRVVVSVSLLRRSVALEIGRSLISVVKPVEEPVVDAPADALLSGGTA